MTTTERYDWAIVEDFNVVDRFTGFDAAKAELAAGGYPDGASVEFSPMPELTR